jgi:aryl-alcohol dehydrogenase-like predicted oxidoreductase/histidinol phosphatase-like enzyme/predicted kinase
MRLSTEPDRDEARSLAVLHAAFDAGVNLLDTADAYCWDDSERGHNERLIARALASWPGDRSRVLVATKGGLTRPDGRWQPDGRAKHLGAACEASCRALGVERLFLYQLHAPDPQTPLQTSVRGLAALERDGLIEAIGLCNVTVGQIEEARRLTDIAAVQVELNLWQDTQVLSGVVEYCLRHDVRLLAFRPLGGPKGVRRALSDPTLREIADRHGATPPEIALAALADLSELIVPLPGPTRIETARAIGRARHLALTDADRNLLDERFSVPRALRRREPMLVSRAAKRDGDIVLIMGLPGAGKSTLAADFTARGYQRLSRDETGGSLRDVAAALDRALAAGNSRIVVDNTYVSRASRARVIQTASQRGLPVRCLWLSTSIEDAQINAVTRILARHGSLLADQELRQASKRDVAAFLPTVQFRYQRAFEPPDAAEGFDAVEVVPFKRRSDASQLNRALIVWCDGVLLRSRSGQRVACSVEDLDVPTEYAAILRQHHSDGWRVLGLSWQPEIASGAQSADGARALFARMSEVLGVPVDVAFCPHPAGPPTCWCRKPLPGLAVVLSQRHKLDRGQCLYVGDGPQDPGFARRLGFKYRSAADFFGSASPPGLSS